MENSWPSVTAHKMVVTINEQKRTTKCYFAENSFKSLDSVSDFLSAWVIKPNAATELLVNQP